MQIYTKGDKFKLVNYHTREVFETNCLATLLRVAGTLGYYHGTKFTQVSNIDEWQDLSLEDKFLPYMTHQYSLMINYMKYRA